MRLAKIKRSVEKFQYASPTEITKELEIKVIEHPRMDDKENDAILITGKKKSIMYIKHELPQEYKNFLILHEIGHRIYHFQEDAQYSFLQSQYTGRLEREANAFACTYLLQNEDLEDICIMDILVAKGVPRETAIQYMEDLQES